jgi:hypothetical protein
VDLVFDVADAGTQGRFAPALLAAQNPRTGAPVVLSCDASLTCSGAAALVGSDPRTGADVSLLRTRDFASSGVVYARTESGIYRSRDGGQRFLPIPLPQPQSGAVYTTIPAAALSAVGQPQIYVAMLEMIGTGRSRLTAGGVYVSSDGGATWHAVGSPGPLDGGATSVATMPDGRLLAGYVDAHGDAGLVCSADAQQWAATCPPESAACSGACGGVIGVQESQAAAPSVRATQPAVGNVEGPHTSVAAPVTSVTGTARTFDALHQGWGRAILLVITMVLAGMTVLLSLGRRLWRRA